MPKPKIIPLLETSFAVIVWGASFIATKIALQDVSPAPVVWLRFLMGVVILGVAVAARGQFSLPKRGEWGYFAVLGFLGIAFHQWLQSNGLQTSQAGDTAWIVATTPVFMALLGWLVLKERLDGLKVVGILLAALGVLLVVSDGNIPARSVGNPSTGSTALRQPFDGFDRLTAGKLRVAAQGNSSPQPGLGHRFGAPGDVLILISALNWAVFSILSRSGLQKHPAAWMMFWVMLAGWLFTSVLFFSGAGLGEMNKLTVNGWAALAFLGIICSGLAYIAWYDALQSLSAAQTGVFLYIEPLIAVIVAAIVLAESITGASLLGGGIILLGVYLVNRV